MIEMEQIKEFTRIVINAYFRTQLEYISTKSFRIQSSS